MNRSFFLLLLAQFACTQSDKDQVDDSTPVLVVDEDEDGFAAEEDCDDSNAEINSGATELCDGVDNNCDGVADEDSAADAATWYADGDADGYGADSTTVVSCTQPEGHAEEGGDCDDSSAVYHPNADESDCTDPNDYNCDGSVGYADADSDGFPACEDCDDSSADISPDDLELCDELDNNCDGNIDEESAADASTWYADTDGDTYGDPGASSKACSAPEQSVADSSDCDDDDAAVSPAGTELCDSIDNNCDGNIDEASAADASTWYTDADGDGYGNPSLSTVSCTQPSGTVSNTVDCDDSDSSVSPLGTELCDSIDNNCDGTIDEASAADARTWYADKDGDSYGDLGSTLRSCSVPSGYGSDSSDCDDSVSATNPSATETCDTIDNDCDGDTDEDDAADAITWYADADADTYGDANVSTTACTAPSGYVADDTDCNDLNARIGPSCTPTFSGATGSSWTKLTASTTYLYSLPTYHEVGEPYIFNFFSTAQRYDISAGTWSNLSSSVPNASSCIWCSAAPSGGYLWLLRYGTVSRYDASADTWKTMTTFSGSDDYNMTEADDFGVVYGHTSAGNIVSYNTTTGTVAYFSTGKGSQYETRMAYDPGTHAIFFGAYSARNLYKYDISTGTVSTMTSHPESQLNDIFCSDRSGHIYAAGGTSGTTMYQYTIASDTWTAIPALPSDHGNNGSCTVSGDGYLYVGTGSFLTFYRLELY